MEPRHAPGDLVGKHRAGFEVAHNASAKTLSEVNASRAMLFRFSRHARRGSTDVPIVEVISQPIRDRVSRGVEEAAVACAAKSAKPARAPTSLPAAPHQGRHIPVPLGANASAAMPRERLHQGFPEKMADRPISRNRAPTRLDRAWCESNRSMAAAFQSPPVRWRPKPEAARDRTRH